MEDHHQQGFTTPPSVKSLDEQQNKSDGERVEPEFKSNLLRRTFSSPFLVHGDDLATVVPVDMDLYAWLANILDRNDQWLLAKLQRNEPEFDDQEYEEIKRNAIRNYKIRLAKTKAVREGIEEGRIECEEQTRFGIKPNLHYLGRHSDRKPPLYYGKPKTHSRYHAGFKPSFPRYGLCQQLGLEIPAHIWLRNLATRDSELEALAKTRTETKLETSGAGAAIMELVFDDTEDEELYKYTHGPFEWQREVVYTTYDGPDDNDSINMSCPSTSTMTSFSDSSEVGDKVGSPVCNTSYLTANKENQDATSRNSVGKSLKSSATTFKSIRKSRKLPISTVHLIRKSRKSTSVLAGTRPSDESSPSESLTPPKTNPKYVKKVKSTPLRKSYEKNDSFCYEANEADDENDSLVEYPVWFHQHRRLDSSESQPTLHHRKNNKCSSSDEGRK